MSNIEVRRREAVLKLKKQIHADLDERGLRKEKRQFFNIRVDDPDDEYIIQSPTDATMDYLESAVPVALPQGYHVYDFDGYFLGIKVDRDRKMTVTSTINFAQTNAVRRILKQKPKPVLTQLTNHEHPIMAVYGAAILYAEDSFPTSRHLYFLQETEDEIWFYGIMNLNVQRLLDDTPRAKPKPLALQRISVFKKKYLVKYFE